MAKNLRQDITGLRAIAVLAVTLFHIDHVMLPQINIFKGGFLGVDIFFVISGFLMTMLIMRKGGGLQSGDFSLLKFYQRRAKRICPALIATIVFFLVLGYFIFSPEDLKNAGREAGKAVLFISNEYFAKRAGYFDTVATDKLFLHTWSLSVEWQFYIVYPFILMLAYRFLSYKNIGRLILGCTVLSLGFACYYTTVNATYSYYMLPSRAFELLFGALAYFYPLSYFQNQQNPNSVVVRYANKLSPAAVEAIGIAIIIASLFLVSDQQGWPTLAAVPPLFGTYLCIAAGNQHSWLRASIFQKLGLWSYAIYLVHWPLIVISTRYNGELQWMWLYLVIPIFALGALMHYTIERRRSYGYKFLVVYLLLGAATFGVAKDGFPQRVEGTDLNIFANYGGHSHRETAQIIHLGNLERQPDFIIAGDSFANQYTSDLMERDLHVIGILLSGCMSLHNNYAFAKEMIQYNGPEYPQKCINHHLQLHKAIKEFPNIPVVIAQRWAADVYPQNIHVRNNQQTLPSQEFNNIIKQGIQNLALDLKGRDVYVLTNQNLFTPNSPKYGNACITLHQLHNPVSRAMLNSFFCKLSDAYAPTANFPINQVIIDTVKQMQADRVMVDANGNGSIHYIDPSKEICDQDKCQRFVNGLLPILSDDNHFSWAGSIAVNSMILKTIGVEQGRVRTEFNTPPQIPLDK